MSLLKVSNLDNNVVHIEFNQHNHQKINLIHQHQIQQMGDELFALAEAPQSHGTRVKPHFVLDFGNVAYLSNNALGKLITFDKKTKIRGSSEMIGAADNIKELFSIMNLDKVFTVSGPEKTIGDVVASRQEGRSR